MKTTKTYETLEAAAVAMLLKTERNMWKIVRTASGKWTLRFASTK